MEMYVMFGKYSAEAVKGISSDRTSKAKNVINQCDGKIHSMHALLGAPYDLLLMANFPNPENAMKASVGLTKMTGINFCTCPAVEAEIFDKMTG